MTTTPSLTDAIEGTVEAYLEGVHTAIPGRIESYDASNQTANIQPLIKGGYIDEEGNRQTENLPVVTNVPIAFPRAGAFGLTFPIAKGDTVLLVFAETSIDKWLTVGGGPLDAGDDRRHDISDAIAIPGLFSRKDPTDQVAAAAAVLFGALQLGGNTAVDGVIKGTTYASGEDTFLAAMGTWLGALLTALNTVLVDPAKTTYGTAHGAFTAALAVWDAANGAAVSTKVKTE